MDYKRGTFWQSVLVWCLFISSIAALFVNSMTAFLVPAQEEKYRAMLSDACLKLSDAANQNSPTFPRDVRPFSKEINHQLEQLTEQVLRRYPGVEGGFYLNHDHDEFAGYAFPTEPIRGPRHELRREPPPREEPYIRLQAKQTSTQETTQPLIQSRDVGPSRVIVGTVPVGSERPAEMVVWLMYRVTGPEQHRAQVHRYQFSTYLALTGIVAALLMTLNLRKTLGKERASQERLREELRRSEHLASLGLMVAQVAHEIRTPLAGIYSTVQLWERLPDQARTPESMQSVKNAVSQLNTLLSKLLYFSKTDTNERSSVDLNRVVKEIVELVRAQAAKQHVELRMELDLTLPVLLGSPSALRQVILNLSTNALQAMPSGGRLTCRTRTDSVANLAVIEVIDNGIGIEPATRARLFEPFFTTRPHGTGLGLALCREIVLQHGGHIELEQVEPHGTVFRVLLPLRKSELREDPLPV